MRWFGCVGIADPDLEGTSGKVDLAHFAGDNFGAEAQGLFAELHHEFGTHDAVGPTRKVLDLGGEHELTAGLIAGRGWFALDEQGGQVGARGIDGAGQAGGTGTDDDDVTNLRHEELQKSMINADHVR